MARTETSQEVGPANSCCCCCGINKSNPIVTHLAIFHCNAHCRQKVNQRLQKVSSTSLDPSARLGGWLWQRNKDVWTVAWHLHIICFANNYWMGLLLNGGLYSSLMGFCALTVYSWKSISTSYLAFLLIAVKFESTLSVHRPDGRNYGAFVISYFLKLNNKGLPPQRHSNHPHFGLQGLAPNRPKIEIQAKMLNILLTYQRNAVSCRHICSYI